MIVGWQLSTTIKAQEDQAWGSVNLHVKLEREELSSSWIIVVEGETWNSVVLLTQTSLFLFKHNTLKWHDEETSKTWTSTDLWEMNKHVREREK